MSIRQDEVIQELSAKKETMTVTVTRVSLCLVWEDFTVDTVSNRNGELLR